MLEDAVMVGSAYGKVFRQPGGCSRPEVSLACRRPEDLLSIPMVSAVAYVLVANITASDTNTCTVAQLQCNMIIYRSSGIPAVFAGADDVQPADLRMLKGLCICARKTPGLCIFAG